MSRLCRAVLIIWTCLYSLNTLGQRSVIDSLKRQAASAINDSLRAFYLNKTGKEYWFINPDTSLLYTQEAFDISRKKNIRGLFPYCYNNLGVLDYLAGNYHESLGKYFEGLKTSKNNPVIHGILLNNIGMVYQELRDYEKANIYYKETLKLKKENKDSSRFAVTYNSIGIVLNSLHQYERAKQYFDSTYYYAKQYNDPYSEADALGNIANYYTRKKDYRQAETYCRNALAIKEKLEDVYGVSTSCSDLANILLNLNKDREAETFLLKGEKLALQNSYYDLLVPLYQNLSDVYKKKGDYKRALSFITKTIAIKDSILSEGKIREAAIKEKEFTHHVKQATDSLKNENERIQIQSAHEKEIYKQKLFIYGALIAAVLMLGVALVVLKAFKEKQKSNLIIEKQKYEVELQKELIEAHQKEILDSIHYAKRIQNTLLAHHEFVDENLPDNFIFFKPKDIVSGDFYWATKHGDHFYLAVCDSTGHGVPGAFMSLLNIGFLNEAINEKDILEPHDVFNHVRRRLVASISKEGQKDGFDGILLCVNQKTGKITYASAHNAPVLISGNGWIELPKDKMPVGKGEYDKSFTIHTINARKGDLLYLYTDGYADQFGGPKGKKFKYKPLNELLLANHQLSLKEQLQALENSFNEWKGNLEQVDDVCVIGIKI